MIDVFYVDDTSQKIDLRFEAVQMLPILSSARGEINRIFNSWAGFDNDFVKQFQTTNFESRTWELYIYEFLFQQLFQIDKCPQERPDFRLIKGDTELFLECVTSNAINGDRSELMLNTLNAEKEEDFISRIGSALFSKLNKNYHELDWVNGKPLILAIQPYHNSESFNMNVYSVVKYLYGINTVNFMGTNGLRVTEFEKIKNFKRNDKNEIIEIGNFFDHPNSKYISGVIFSNAATIGKFTRMGFQNGFGTKDTFNIMYFGVCYNHDLSDPRLGFFCNSIKDNPFDNYFYGITLFHNPNALYPIDEDLFKCTQCKIINDEVFWKRMEFYPYNGKNFRTIRPLTEDEINLCKKYLGRESFKEFKTKG